MDRQDQEYNAKDCWTVIESYFENYHSTTPTMFRLQRSPISSQK